MAYLNKIWSSTAPVDATTYVGDIGTIFYDIYTGVLRLSDGTTPGGISVSVGAVINTNSISTTDLTVVNPITGNISGNASTATSLSNLRTISASGDGTWSVNFDGSANVTSSLTLANVVTAGTYKSVNVNAKGLVTGGEPGSTSGTQISFYTGIVAPITGTTIIPNTDIAPLISDGTEIFTHTVTPSATNSKYLIDFSAMSSADIKDSYVVFALFRDSTCISAVDVTIGSVGDSRTAVTHWLDSPNTTSPVTYSMRVGINMAGTWYVARGHNTTDLKLSTNYTLL